MKFYLRRSGQLWYATIVSRNGRVLFESATYESKRGAENTIRSVARGFGLKRFTVVEVLS